MLNTVSNSCRLLGLGTSKCFRRKSKLLGPAIHKHFLMQITIHIFMVAITLYIAIMGGAVPEHLQEIVKKNLLKKYSMVL